jgi:hypothetical protein
LLIKRWNASPNFLKGSAGDELTFVEIENQLAVTDCGQSMRDDDCGDLSTQFVNRGSDIALSLSVKRTCCLIHYKESWVGVERAGNAQALTLATA